MIKLIVGYEKTIFKHRIESKFFMIKANEILFLWLSGVHVCMIF